MLSVIIPTYNEAENVSLLNRHIAGALAGIDYELIFVDDSSDETHEVLNKLAALDSRVRCCHRSSKRGLASAVVQGFKLAKGEYLAVMDADLQHPPHLLPHMLKAAEAGADLVIPSRFVPGGSDGGLKPHRKFVSWVARALGKVMLHRLRKVSDPTGGFFLLRREVIRNAPLNPVGWKILIEVLVKGQYARIAEIPYAFGPRTHNQSKMSLREQVNYLKHLARLVRQSPRDRCFWQSAVRESAALIVGTVVYTLLYEIVDDHLAVLLAALAYTPANRALNLPQAVSSRAFENSAGLLTKRLILAVATGTGWILGIYLLCIEVFILPGVASYLAGSLSRTLAALFAPSLRLQFRTLAERFSGTLEK